jgi:hypothetical protein
MRGFSPLARSLVVLLGVAISCASFCPPRTCEHDCCPQHSGDCLPGGALPALACIQSATLTAPALSNEQSGTFAVVRVAHQDAKLGVVRSAGFAGPPRDGVLALGARSSPLRI